jgi:hypothetical protein
MPRHDPIPKDHERAARAWARYKRMMRWMALAAVAAALLALLYLRSVGGAMPLSMMIATALGVGLTVLLGTGLMGLVFLSDRGGHDEAAGGRSGDRR